MNLFLDIETTGLPAKNADWKVDYKKFPRVVEIAWKISNRTSRFIIHQDGKPIPKEASNIHGITTKMGNDLKVAKSAEEVYKLFLKDTEEAWNIIGHNIYFDTSIIKAEI